MNASDKELRDIGLFIQESLAAYIKNKGSVTPTDNLNWRELQAIVRGRNLGSLFAFCHNSSLLPPPVLQEWEQQKMRTSLQNLAKLKVTTDITAIAERAGVRVVAMRGIVLAHNLYQDPAMRPMHDTDLLIRPSDKEQFLTAMREEGFEPTDFFRSQYVYKIQGVVVEVHWELLSNKRYREKIDSDILVATATKQETENGFYYTLSDRWEIIGLITHAFTHHNLSQLYSLIDIALYMHDKDIDWQDIAVWSRKMGLSRMVLLTLGFVNNFFGLEIDEPVLTSFNLRTDKVARYYPFYMEQTLGKITLKTHIGIKQSQFYVAETCMNKFREFLRLLSAKELRFVVDLLRRTPKSKKQKLRV